MDQEEQLFGDEQLTAEEKQQHELSKKILAMVGVRRPPSGGESYTPSRRRRGGYAAAASATHVVAATARGVGLRLAPTASRGGTPQPTKKNRYAFEAGAKPNDGDARLSASALSRALKALGRDDSDGDACAKMVRAGDWRSGNGDRGVSRSDFYECLGSRDDKGLAKTCWTALWGWFPKLETRADVKARLALDSVQETPRNPGVFGLWRPLSRSDASRFGAFLDR